MKYEMEQLLNQWRDESQLSTAKQDEIRLAARSTPALSVEWWREVMSIPKTVFGSKAA